MYTERDLYLTGIFTLCIHTICFSTVELLPSRDTKFFTNVSGACI